jgi:hypothetical protein
MISSRRSLPQYLSKGSATRGFAPQTDVDERVRQALAGLSGLAKDLGLPIIVLTTAGRDAIALAQAAFPAVCLRQLPLPLKDLLALIEALHPAVPSSALSSSE